MNEKVFFSVCLLLKRRLQERRFTDVELTKAYFKAFEVLYIASAGSYHET